MEDPRWQSRTFRDDAGRAWQVFERRRAGADGELVTLLVFESDAAIRCVRRYPANWRELPPDELEALSWSV
jgi:hypothetical protein